MAAVARDGLPPRVTQMILLETSLKPLFVLIG